MEIYSTIAALKLTSNCSICQKNCCEIKQQQASVNLFDDNESEEACRAMQCVARNVRQNYHFTYFLKNYNENVIIVMHVYMFIFYSFSQLISCGMEQRWLLVFGLLTLAAAVCAGTYLSIPHIGLLCVQMKRSKVYNKHKVIHPNRAFCFLI